MISTRWLEKRKPHWSKLETLLNQSAKSGLKSLSRSDLQELSLLYRQTAADPGEAERLLAPVLRALPNEEAQALGAAPRRGWLRQRRGGPDAR